MSAPLIPQGHELVKPAPPALVAVTLMVCLALNWLPWADTARWLLPDLVLMTLLYWGLRTPHVAGIGVAFLLGILMDLSQGGLLGVHAMTYSVAIYAMQGIYRRLEGFTAAGRALQVAPILIGVQLLGWLVALLFRQLDIEWLVLAGILLSALVWPVWVRALEFFAGPLPTLRPRDSSSSLS